eukprot:m.258493 g.258493  ORF g.258493 m.258493 type:complete len:187 (-) comp36658_c0_seq1:957-1517(-)
MSGIGLEEKEGGQKHLIARLTGENIAVSGTCKKCGFAGHLRFQCKNTATSQSMKFEDTKKPKDSTEVLDVSSTSSAESEDSILALNSDVSSEEDLAALKRDGRDFFGRDMRDSNGRVKKERSKSDRKRAHTPAGSDSEGDDEDERKRPRPSKSKKSKKDKKKSKKPEKEKKSKKAKKSKKSKKSKR